MTKDDIIKLAREAGIGVEKDIDDWSVPVWHLGIDYLERFAALVAAAERERIVAKNVPEIEKINTHIKALEEAVLAEREECAKWLDFYDGPNCRRAEAIRARGNRT